MMKSSAAIPSPAVNEWDVMTDEISQGHTIASDGEVYLADDTENHRILVFEKEDGKFLHTQTFPISVSGPIISFMMRKPAVFMF